MAETNHIPDKLVDFFRNPTYERRLVIFYDVLGWRNHIKAADGKIEKIGDLRRLILQSHRSLRLRHQFKMRISTFSDNIVVTQAVDEKTPLLLTLLALQQIAAAMKGFLLRGGITVGDIIHDDECVFDPGLNRAHELESTIAQYPRFAVDRDVIEEIGNIGGLAVLEDDVLFLDPFRLGFMDFMKDGRHEELDKTLVLQAELPAPKNSLSKYHREQLLRSVLHALKPQIIRSTLKDKEWNKIAWVYDRFATQLGDAPAKSYR
jgi:hypothetical protein